MKTPFFRKRSLAGWALMTGTLGLTVPAAAQVSSYLPAGAGTTAAHREPTSLSADAQSRLEAIEIELAWLADPITFPYNLTIYPAGVAFEVRGFVPSEAVRAHALQTARARTRRIVTDTVRVYPGMAAARTASAPPDAIQKGATALLLELMGERARPLTVRANDAGQVSLAGSVSCHEEKLTLSRRLRGLRGCTCVENSLGVVTVLRDGKLYHQVTADGQHKVPAHPEVLHVNHATPRTTAETPRTASVAREPQPVGAPLSLQPAPPATTTTLKPGAPVLRTAFQPAGDQLPSSNASAPPVSSLPAVVQTPGPRVTMVKVWEMVPGSLTAVQRTIPILLSGTGRGLATRQLLEEEIAQLRACQQQPAPHSETALQPTPRPPTVAAPSSTPPPSPQRTASAPKPAENVPPVRPQTQAVPTVKEQRPAPSPVVPVAVKPSSEPAARAPVQEQRVPSADLERPPQPTVPSRVEPNRPPVSSQNSLTPANRPTPNAESKPAVMIPPAIMNRPAPQPSPTKPEPTVTAPVERRPPAAPTTPTVNKPAAPSTPPAPPSPPKAAVEKKPAVAAPAPYVAKGVVTLAEPEDKRQAALPRPTPAAPYVSRGTVIFHEEPAPAAAPKPSLAEVRKRIETACGKEVRDVEVVRRSTSQLRIQFKVAKAEDAPRLSEKILSLPELAPYEVTLEALVTQP